MYSVSFLPLYDGPRFLSPFLSAFPRARANLARAAEVFGPPPSARLVLHPLFAEKTF